MPRMGCDDVPQLEHDTEELGADDGGQQTRCGEDRRRGPRGGQREL